MFRLARMGGFRGPQALSHRFLFPKTPKVQADFSHKPFDLQQQRPFAEHARQILIENLDMTFIGVFHRETKEITLMPAMKDNNLHLVYNDHNEIIKGKKMRGQALTEKELDIIKNEAKLFIARRSSKANSAMFYPAHVEVLSHMKVTDRSPFYGFSVTHHTDGSIKLIGDSVSLNHNKPGTTSGKTMCPTVLKEIETIIRGWFPDASNDRKISRP